MTNDDLATAISYYEQHRTSAGTHSFINSATIAATLIFLRELQERRAVPEQTALKCPACKRPFEEVKVSELREYFSPEPAAEPEWTREAGWLIENGKNGDALRYRTMEQGMPAWTADNLKALRFARRDDAEMFAAEDDAAWRIAQHIWSGPPSPNRPAPKNEMLPVDWLQSLCPLCKLPLGQHIAGKVPGCPPRTTTEPT